MSKRYADLYTQYGLAKMIDNYQSKMKKLEIERKDIGLSWTKKHIELHIDRIDSEIRDCVKLIDELKQAIKTRQLRGHI